MSRLGLLLEALAWALLVAVLSVQSYNLGKLHGRLARLEGLAAAEVVIAGDTVKVKAR